MGAKWIQEAAEERYADYGDQFEDAIAHATRTAFIAGVELGLAKAAEVAESEITRTTYSRTADIAAAIRALGSDENEGRADG